LEGETVGKRRKTAETLPSRDHYDVVLGEIVALLESARHAVDLSSHGASPASETSYERGTANDTTARPSQECSIREPVWLVQSEGLAVARRRKRGTTDTLPFRNSTCA
jgi:hypothetical protein